MPADKMLQSLIGLWQHLNQGLKCTDSRFHAVHKGILCSLQCFFGNFKMIIVKVI